MKNKIVRLQGENFRAWIYPGDPITRCKLQWFFKDRNDVMVFGIGFRKASDPYDYETGCRMALKSALRDLLPADRSLVWDEYFALFPPDQRPTEQAKLASYARHIERRCEAIGFRKAMENVSADLFQRCAEALIEEEMLQAKKRILLAHIRRIERAKKQEQADATHTESGEWNPEAITVGEDHDDD